MLSKLIAVYMLHFTIQMDLTYGSSAEFTMEIGNLRKELRCGMDYFCSFETHIHRETGKILSTTHYDVF